MNARALAPLLFFGTGCLSMNTFETARALEPGTVSHSVSLTSYVQPGRDPRPVPMPSYALHFGVADDFDMGALVGLPGHLRLIGKYNPVRTEWFDAAIAPGLWLAWVPHDVDNEDHSIILGGDLPVMLDVNAGPVTIVPFAGPGFAYSPEGDTIGMIVRTGLGIRFPIAKSVRLHPEFSTVIDPLRGVPVDYAFGIAVDLGADPHLM